MSCGTTQCATEAKQARLNAALMFAGSARRPALVRPQGLTGRPLWNSFGFAAFDVKRRGILAAKAKSLNLAARDVLCCTFGPRQCCHVTWVTLFKRGLQKQFQ